MGSPQPETEHPLPPGTLWPLDVQQLPIRTSELIKARWEFLQLSKALGSDLEFYKNVIRELRDLGWLVIYTGKEGK